MEHPINFAHMHVNSKRSDKAIMHQTTFSVKKQIKTFSQAGLNGKAISDKLAEALVDLSMLVLVLKYLRHTLKSMIFLER